MRRYCGAGCQRRSERLNPLPDCLYGAASGQNWSRVTRMLYLMPGRASQTNYRFAGWLTKSGVGVEKGASERNVVLVASTPVVRITSPVRLQLCCSQRRFCSLAEEADQSLDVLRSRCHEELLANKF